MPHEPRAHPSRLHVGAVADRVILDPWAVFAQRVRHPAHHRVGDVDGEARPAVGVTVATNVHGPLVAVREPNIRHRLGAVLGLRGQ